MKLTITNSTTFQTISLDVLRLDFTPEAAVTEHPVELGANVTDHTQVKPLRFAAETIATPSPRGFIPAPLAVSIATTFLELNLGKVVNVIIPGVGVFNSYALEAAPYSVTPRDARVFSLRFKQIRIAASVSVTIPARLPAPVASVGSPSAQGLGQQAAATAPESLLNAIANAVGF